MIGTAWKAVGAFTGFSFDYYSFRQPFGDIMKICRECAHVSSGSSCYRNVYDEINLISGSTEIRGYLSCYYERNPTWIDRLFRNPCGVEGKYWTPKVSKSDE